LAVDNSDGITAAYIDFAKAFDSVSHQKLLYKLQNYGISGNLLNWIKNLLSGRLQCTKVGDIFSPYRHLSSGVIQLSCLGPLLFVIYVNDVVSLFGEDCVCNLYADDMKLYMRTNSSSSSYCASRLQNYLDRLAHWSRILQLNIAYQKCAVMQIGNIVPDCSYTIASNRLSNVDIVKDLGVFVRESLTFSSHMSYCHSCVY